MEKFILHNSVKKELINTDYGIVSVETVNIDPVNLEKYIIEIIMDIDNLKYIFNEKEISERTHINFMRRFIPSNFDEIKDLDEYLSHQITNKKSFYSFLAEALTGLIFRDIYDYNTTKSLIDINDTLIDGHTGVDSCLFDDINKKLIIGEAKFYKSFTSGLNQIITDYTCEQGFFNKIDSFKRHIQNNEIANSIILRNLGQKDHYEYTFEELFSMDIVFSGFVLHEHSGDVDKYISCNFYDKFMVSTEKIQDNIFSVFNLTKTSENHRIILFHLPINNKKDLIKKIIIRANAIKKDKIKVGVENE